MTSYKAFKPRVVAVMIGINDLAFHTKDWLISRYPGFIAELRRDYSGAIIFLQSILPVNNPVSTTGLSNAEINVFNLELRGICIAANVDLLELAPGFKDEESRLKADWTADGMHLNGSGYQFWAGPLRSYLKAQKIQ